jgi:hypothetical protein
VDSYTPAAKNPCWQEWSDPLHHFLDKPRNWKELREWGKKNMGQARLRQCLAWLEEKGLAYSGYSLDKTVFWARTESRILLFNSSFDVKHYKDTEKCRQQKRHKGGPVKPNGK